MTVLGIQDDDERSEAPRSNWSWQNVIMVVVLVTQVGNWVFGLGGGYRDLVTKHDLDEAVKEIKSETVDKKLYEVEQREQNSKIDRNASDIKEIAPRIRRLDQ